MHIIQTLYAAAGNHGNIDAARQIDGRFNIAASQQTIPPNIGEQTDATPASSNRRAISTHADFRHIGPTFGSDHAIARIDRDDNAALIFLRHIAHKFRDL